MSSKLSQKKIRDIVATYDPRKITIGVLGGHSALDVCHGVKKFGFRTVVVAQKGREETYTKYYRTRNFSDVEKKIMMDERGEEFVCCGKGSCGCGEMQDGKVKKCGGSCGCKDEDEKNECEGECGNDENSGCCGGGGCGSRTAGDFAIGCIDEVMVVDKFSDITKPDVQKRLRDMHVVFVHNRYFWVYCDFEKIEHEFEVPIYGNRQAVKLEERDQPNNQYWLLQEAGIRTPKIFKSYKEIDRLVIVKVNEATRGYERAFFVASSPKQCLETANKMAREGKISMDAFEKATIEEYVLGAQVNLNFFYSPLTNRLELMGTDTRRQANLDGYLRLPADQQLEVLQMQQPKMIETGHFAVTMKESLVEKAYDLGEKFVRVMEREVSPGMIGPFALQGAVVAEDGKEDFVIFDVSMRIPGSPGTKFTPYSGYLFGDSLSYGERIGIELRTAVNKGRLAELVS
jgi:5-formaminoimidazole-4-carboxamide-1-(beta)-D-ribofuranosyl 5'-monophosphate synthetase